MSWFRRNKKEPVVSKSTIMRNDLNLIKKERSKYYSELIINLIYGSCKQGLGSINLSSIKGCYGYYEFEGVIVYYDNEIRDILIEEEIASYTASGNTLVVTTDEYRLKNLKKDLNKL